MSRTLDYGLLKFVKSGNIVRITHNNEMYVAIVNSIPKEIIGANSVIKLKSGKDEPNINANNNSVPNSKRARNIQKIKNKTAKRQESVSLIINVSTKFSNNLSSVLQRKDAQEIDLPIEEIKIGFITLDEYKQIEEVIFEPDISSDVRSYWVSQKENNLKLIKRVLKGKESITGAMGKRPTNVVFDPKVLTTEYESNIEKRNLQQKMKRTQVMRRAKMRKKDPIEQFKLREKMQKMKLQRNVKKQQQKNSDSIDETKPPV